MQDGVGLCPNSLLGDDAAVRTRRHMPTAPQVLQIMMNAQKNMKVAAWRSWNGWSEADGADSAFSVILNLTGRVDGVFMIT